MKKPDPKSDAPAVFKGTRKQVYLQCFRCHQKTTEVEMHRYMESVHYKRHVRCQDCHGTENHNEYLVLSFRFKLSTLGADGKTPIGSGEDREYAEWWPYMKVRASQACMNCHPAQYKEFLGLDRRPENLENAATPFHGYLRFDMGISGWWDTVQANFGVAEKDVWGNEMFAQGCIMCHSQTMEFNSAGRNPENLQPVRKAFPDILENQEKVLGKSGLETLYVVKCIECHARHKFDRKEATVTGACAKCHMGPDHPQMEAFESSKHGWIYDLYGPYPEGKGPGCATCHYTQKARDGHTVHSSVNGIAWNYKKATRDFLKAREVMLTACSHCHSTTRAKAHLQLADGVAREVTGGLMKEAQSLLDEMYDKKLIEPAFSPFFGEKTRFKPTFFHALPWGTGKYRASKAEQLFWNAWREYGVLSQETGAFHFNPAYSHWKGLKPATEFIGELREYKEELEKEAAHSSSRRAGEATPSP